MKTKPQDPSSPCTVNIADNEFSGFTKREAIAKDMLAALITAGYADRNSAIAISRTAIDIADTFIKALNEKYKADASITQ